MVDIIGA